MSISFPRIAADTFSPSRKPSARIQPSVNRFQFNQPLTQDTFVRQVRFGQTIQLAIPSNDTPLRKVDTATTGGTIDMERTEKGTSTFSGVQESSSTQAIFKTPVDSSNIDRPHQQQILNWVYQQYLHHPDSEGPNGLVIKHGTDTMEDTAALLSFQHLPNVIVLTGAYTTDVKKSDGPNNLKRAQWLASVMPHNGVYVLIGNEVHLGSQVKKVNSYPWGSPDEPNSYFESITKQPLATFDADGRLIFNQEVSSQYFNTTASTTETPFLPLNLSEIPQPAYVEHVLFNQFTPKSVFDDLISRLNTVSKTEDKPNGAILEGDWRRHPEANEIARDIEFQTKQGHFIVSTNQNLQLKNQASVISTISPSHLRTKLSVILSRPDFTSDHIHRERRVFASLNENIAGEMVGTEVAKRYNLDVPAGFASKHQIVMVTPSTTPQVIQNAAKHLGWQPGQTEHPILLIVGTGDGHLPIGNVVSHFDEVKSLLEGSHRNNIKQFILKLYKQMFKVTSQKKNQKLQQAMHQRLVSESPMLKAIDDALEKGVKVCMGSKAYLLEPNLNAYEIGYLLHFLKVHPTTGESGFPCNTQDFLDKYRSN